jgi:uncharacterized protein DUF6221
MPVSDPVAFAAARLTAFVTARLDEEQHRAGTMEHSTVFEQPWNSCPASRTEPFGDLEWGPDAPCDCHLAERKARALRAVESKRSIVRRCAGVMNELDVYPNGLVSPRALLARQVLMAIAAIDSDHPDYDQEWKP